MYTKWYFLLIAEMYHLANSYLLETGLRHGEVGGKYRCGRGATNLLRVVHQLRDLLSHKLFPRVSFKPRMYFNVCYSNNSCYTITDQLS